MPIKIGNTTITKVMLGTTELKKIIIGTATIHEVIDNYTVTFIANGTVVTTKTCAPGGKVTLPSNPTRSGWGFSKWVYGTSNTQFTANTVVNSDITVYAYWSKYGSLGTSTCSNCYGSGYADNWTSCTTCYGLGYIENTTDSCPECGGEGCSVCQWSGKPACSTCDGEGGYYVYGKCRNCSGTGEVTNYGYTYEKY